MGKKLLGWTLDLLILPVMVGILALVVVGVPAVVGDRMLLALPLWALALGGGGYLVYWLSSQARRVRG